MGQPAEYRVRSGEIQLRQPLIDHLDDSKRLLGHGAAPRPSDVEIRHRQRILLDELTPRLDLIAHQRGEDLIRRYRVLDAHLQQPPRLRIDRGLPELLGIHLTQSLVALYRLALAGLLEQPGHRLFERADVLALLAAHDVGAFADQTGERTRELGDALILRRFEELPMQQLFGGKTMLGLAHDDARGLTVGARAQLDLEAAPPVVAGVQ